MVPIFHLQPDAPLPLYAQLEREIKLAVTMGALKIGDRLPTVRQMAVDLRINANTVAKVYAELEREGLLSTRRGVGTFVQALPLARPVSSPHKRKEELRLMMERFLSEATLRGYTRHELLEEMQHIHLPPQGESP
jgi:GntR family transcriptional regulator